MREAGRERQSPLWRLEVSRGRKEGGNDGRGGEEGEARQRSQGRDAEWVGGRGWWEVDDAGEGRGRRGGEGERGGKGRGDQERRGLEGVRKRERETYWGRGRSSFLKSRLFRPVHLRKRPRREKRRNLGLGSRDELSGTKQA